MDPGKRVFRAVTDPKIRHVGFFASQPENSPQPDPSSPRRFSPSGGSSLAPVMIPPPRHPLRHHPPRATTPVGSYNPSEFLFSCPTSEFSDCSSGKLSSSLPNGVFDFDSVVNRPVSCDSVGVTTEERADVEIQDGEEKIDRTVRFITDERVNEEILEGKRKMEENKPLKERTTKAERRAMQDAQRADKAKARGMKKSAGVSGSTLSPAMINSSSKMGPRKKDNPQIAASEKKGAGDRQLGKERKNEIPNPRMQFDDENRVEKAEKRSILKQTEARNRVELLRHLPQYEHGQLLPELEKNFFQLDSVHPAIHKVGMRYLSGDISGCNARCVTMLEAFKESIEDYSTPPQKALARDLMAKLNGYISFLCQCRPMSISMGNAINFLKSKINNLSLDLSESEAKEILTSEIDRFIHEKIILANKALVKHAVSKIKNGDVLLTYASSSTVEMSLLHAHELGKQFRVVIVDSRPKLEGRLLLRRLVGKGINCTYTHINAVSYIMHEVTKVFLGASSVFANGTVYSGVGTSCVAMVAHHFHVPVLVMCEAYKFHQRVQLDSICFNELGDPDAVSMVSGKNDVKYLDGWASTKNLQLLNLLYDVTPSDYVTMIVTDYGIIPTTSVPVIVRECRREV